MPKPKPEKKKTSEKIYEDGKMREEEGKIYDYEGKNPDLNEVKEIDKNAKH